MYPIPESLNTPKPNDCVIDCEKECHEVFSNLRVMPTLKRGSLIEWDLHPNFRDPGPYTVQLQFGRTGAPDADDWSNVGFPAIDAFFLVDDEQRVYGKTNWAHYRIVMTTPTATYLSPVASSVGDLSFQDRRVFAELIRAELIMLRKQTSSGSRAGALLKRRIAGAPCSCLDFLTNEVKDPECELCYGTGFAGGYYAPVYCTYAAMDPNRTHNNLDAGQSRGTIDEGLVIPARMIAVPQLFEEDVWVDPKNDNRWYVHSIASVVEWRGVPVVVRAELRLAPYTDPIYNIDVAGLLPSGLAAS